MRYRTRVSIWKYIQDPDAKSPEEDAEDDAPVQAEAGYENTVSQNPKINA